MNLRKKDFIAIAVVTLLYLPVLYLVMLFVTGAARIEFGFKDAPKEEKPKFEEMKHSARRDSLAIQNSRTFQALQQERHELARERERLLELQTRLDMIQKEIEQKKLELGNERSKLETLLENSSEEEAARFKKLAKMYGAMKPAEAASILETLPESQAAKIISLLTDDRQKAKIMSQLSTEKATRISQLLSKGV